MAISRAQLLKELLPGLNTLFGMEYRRYENQHAEIYTDVENSERSFEEETKLSGFDTAPVKREGEAIAYDEAQEVWTQRYDHETIAMGFSITEEAVEDNLYDSLSARYTKALARSMSNTKQVKAVNPINNGFGSYTTGDAVALFSASHPLVSGGVNSNRPAVATDLNEASIEQAAIDIAAWTDERGLLIAARPRKLVVPPALQFVATRLLQTQYRTETTDNDISAIYTNGTVPQGYAINNFLTDPNQWTLLTDCPNGFKMFNRVALSNSMDGDFDTGNVRYKSRERYSFGVSDPLGAYGSPGSS
ncbi:MAG TPA: Mu-like prophage major head subunit gpT family protein [Candidatus Heimdallarchaeota archaeon]|nr:Mu-like prophage major head subunit gpT family protein [Candidatus Heimdallarchaeota archaeon]